MSSEIRIPVKLFVSKFPQSMTEESLREIFDSFGDVESLVILKSKDPSRTQGCGFVRFASVTDAAKAIHDLNGKYVVESDIGPLNVEYAAGEAERLNLPSTAEGTSVKLFIGGIPITMTDDELKDYFSEFGTVLDCHSLPPKSNNPDLNTKAAFVRFSRKSEAQAAIETCDKKRSFPGIERTMDVRTAESKSAAAPSDRHPPAMPYQQQPQRYPPSRQQHHSSQAYHAPGMVTPSLPIPFVQQPIMRQPRTIGMWTEYYTSDGRPYYHNLSTNTTSWETPMEFRVSNYPPPRAAPAAPPMSSVGGPVADVKGPPGSNLFVFHVPTEWSDHDLHMHFAPYGNLLSARVAREKETHRPKGFGFVSYDNAASASAAVNSLNGFMVSNGKRLKVSIKKGEDGSMGPMMGGIQRPHAGHYAPY